MRNLAKTLGALLITALLLAAPAQAQFGLSDFSSTFEAEEGAPEPPPAGSHRFEAVTTFNVNTFIDSETGKPMPESDLKTLRLQFPPGFIGSITAVPRCTNAEFLTVDIVGYPACPNESAIGTTQTQIAEPGEPFGEPVYNLTPPPGVALKIGFIAFNIPFTIEAGINGEPPNNAVASVINIPQVVPFFGSSTQLWGYPAASVHDPYRGRCLTITPVDNYGELVSNGNCDTTAPEVPFLTLPRSCEATLTTSYEALSWQQPNAVPDKGSSSPPGLTGCSDLDFAPQVSAKPSTTSTEAASGLEFGIDIEDEGLLEPNERAQSDVKDLTVRMPAGMTLNPSAANGLAACPRPAYESETLSTPPGQGCPEASKVGEIEAESTLLPPGEILEGSVFLASQDDNPFGSLLALYVVVKSPQLGILVKRALKVEANEEQGPNSGQIATFAADFPQVPISHLRFRFNQGPRAPLVTPPTCATYNTEAQFTPWSEPGAPHAALFTPFDITSGVNGGPCPTGALPFKPGFRAGSTNNAAGAYSPFDMRFTRADGEQEITRLDAVLPKGMSGKLAGISKCPDSAVGVAKGKSGRAEIANSSCPANSQIGRTLGGAGVGDVLTYVPGKLYLGGPFAGAPLSVIAITPAVAGPLDVGNIVVQAALEVDPETAEVRINGAKSDPIPHALKGVPVKVRDLRIYADRPDFALNPTSCDKKEAKATLWGSYLNVFSPADDVPVSLANRYQAAGCGALKFKPNLALKLKGGTKRGAHPALTATLTYPPGSGYANLASIVSKLPHSAFLEQSHIRTICTRVQFAAKQCPPGSIYGKARVFSPLLDEPLEGPVYLRSSSNPLPDLVLALHGIIDFNLVGRIDSVKASIRASFESIPDAPVSKAILELRGGKKGLIVNSRNLCAHKSKANATYVAQSGKAYEQRPVVKATGCKKGKRRK
jgi:hypothetical protein